MGLKKYEIITVGSDRRVRALRSWQVGDRYVNIGDVGGIVYDEKTLSQDGACWLFRGNFGFPGARIGGDSIVDVAETALSTTGTPAVDILGSSVVVGSKLQFAARQTAEDAVVLTAADFEQGSFNAPIVGNPLTGSDSPNYVRTKNPIFAGGKIVTLKCGVEGYSVQAFALDRDGLVIAGTRATATGAGVTITVPAGQYFSLMMTKDPADETAPADATAAQITFTGAYETKLSIIDSRLEVGPATVAGTAIIRPGGNHATSPGAKYPDSVIQNSKVSMMAHATAGRTITLMAEFINTSAVIDATAGEVVIAGLYSNIKNLAASGVLPAIPNVAARSIIQATDCDSFAVSPTIFSDLVTALLANMPFIFQGCNVPNGIFYHHAQIANTYKNIDFAKAQTDLGKTIFGGPLVSSEVEGMYRVIRIDVGAFGALIESYESVKSLSISAVQNSYGTTIYKDAYLNGKFDFAGTNVFGHKVRSHPLAQVLNVQPRAVRGTINASAVGETVTGIVQASTRAIIPFPLRVNGGTGLRVDNIPAGIECNFTFVSLAGVVTAFGTWAANSANVATAQLKEYAAYVSFRKADNTSAITPEDLAGVTVTVYNGCKIMNTGATAVNMKGNIRVEDNATIVNASVVGSGYFGGNSVVYYNPAVWAALECNGLANMKDNAVFAPTALVGSCALVHMEGNAKFIGSGARTSTELSFIMRDNAIIEGVSNTRSGVVMSGNAKVTSTGVIAAASRGALVMTDNASIEASTTVIGAITLAGNYKGNVVKTWVGKRTITDVNEPEYDNNVKSKYDL